MRARVAVWVLAAVAISCGASGAVYADSVFHLYRVEPTSIGFVIGEAMRATILLLLAGGAIVGLLVLRGVAEMCDQVLRAIRTDEPSPAVDDRAPVDQEGRIT